MKVNGPGGNPLAESSAVRAEGPGIGTTRCPPLCANRTSRAPGSEMPGVPLSLTSATRPPRSRTSRIRVALCGSLNR